MEDGHEMEAPRRVISASCFRILAFQPEIQDDEEVLKPNLDALEVLGALPNVNPKHFDYEKLEAKDFDEDLAHFLCSDLVASDSTSPHVRVVGVLGKEDQVKSHLHSISAWMKARGRSCSVGRPDCTLCC